jgi:transposase
MKTDEQVARYRKLRESGKSQELAAAMSSMTAKTARKYEVGPLPSQTKAPRDWRTRPDPFQKDWDTVVEPLLAKDEKRVLQATTVLEELKKAKPDQYSDKELRTLQRRMREWRAVQGPPKEVFFPQDHRPGREAQMDFTHATELAVTIAGVPLAHLFFELILNYSGHRYVQIAYSENFESLSDGLQAGLWAFGGVPEQICHDSLSAATHELRKTGGRALTPRFAALIRHFKTRSRRIRVRKANENGVVESGHRTLKNALDQALIVRGSRDFPTLVTYLEFVAEVVAALNRRCAERFEEERASLQSLPYARIPSFTDFEARVSRWSIIRVATQIYSVPSRLIGEKVTVRLHPAEVEVIYKGKSEKFPRLQGRGAHRIDYRHIIHSLVRKPGAFEGYRFREELFPTVVFRRAFDALKDSQGERGHVDYLQILNLAAKRMEVDVEAALEVLLEAGQSFRFSDVEALVEPAEPRTEELVAPLQPEPASYDALLEEEEVCRVE